MGTTKLLRRKKIHLTIRSDIQGTAERPRLNVYRSNKDIYCQLIDDLAGTTLASSSSKEISEGSKEERAKKTGLQLAEKAKALKIDEVVFDRGGYLYHGRVKALADGAREGGLKF